MPCHAQYHAPSQDDPAKYRPGGSTILTIPVELVERVLTFCHPRDVAAFSQTCHLAYVVVYHPLDEYLWRELFLSYPFNDPRRSSQGAWKTDSPPALGGGWKHELLRRMDAERFCLSSKASPHEKKAALKTLIHVVQQSTTLGSGMLASYDLRWIERVLRQSRILDDEIETFAGDAGQVVAQLRSYVALSLDKADDDETNCRLKVRRNKSRSYVYDLRHYTSDNRWGPYLDGGRVNWIHMESLINVILANLRELPGSRNHTTPPLGLEATYAYSAPALSPSKEDWAGVEGTWRRYVCFMDYRDLFAFNYSDLPSGTRDPSFFEDLRLREATRLIEMKLHLIPREELRFLQATTVACNTWYPSLYFAGSSTGVNGPEASVEGVVRMGSDGLVRWQFASMYSSDVRWSSDGAQVGSIASAFGIVGVWTTVLHDEGDPAGPFWMWKVEDDDPTQLMDYN